MRFLLLPFLIIWHLFTSPTTAHTRMIDHVSGSIVRVTGQENGIPAYCTGIVIAPNQVLTAAHCIDMTMLQGDGYAATLLQHDEFVDLALFTIKTHKPALCVRDIPVRRYEPLTGIGYAFGWTRLTAIAVTSLLVDYRPYPDMPSGVFVHPSFIGGMSGGPVVDDTGCLVSIVQQGREGMAFGVSALTIRAFLLGSNVER